MELHRTLDPYVVRESFMRSSYGKSSRLFARNGFVYGSTYRKSQGKYLPLYTNMHSLVSQLSPNLIETDLAKEIDSLLHQHESLGEERMAFTHVVAKQVIHSRQITMDSQPFEGKLMQFPVHIHGERPCQSIYHTQGVNASCWLCAKQISGNKGRWTCGIVSHQYVACPTCYESIGESFYGAGRIVAASPMLLLRAIGSNFWSSYNFDSGVEMIQSIESKRCIAYFRAVMDGDITITNRQFQQKRFEVIPRVNGSHWFLILVIYPLGLEKKKVYIVDSLNKQPKLDLLDFIDPNKT